MLFIHEFYSKEKYVRYDFAVNVCMYEYNFHLIGKTLILFSFSFVVERKVNDM